MQLKEQEKFLDVILYNDEDKISNVYIGAFLKSDIKKSELCDKIIEYSHFTYGIRILYEKRRA